MDEQEYEQVPRLVSVKETARLLGLHYNTVYKLIYERKLPAVEVIKGRKYMIEAREINKYINARRTAPPLAVPENN